MHACTVTETGFDTEKGDFVKTEVGGNSGASTGSHLGIVVTAADGAVLNILALPEEISNIIHEETSTQN